MTWILHSLNLLKKKSLCNSGGRMSVTYFSYRFKYVTNAGYVVQNLDTVTPKTWESVQVFTYLLIRHKKKNAVPNLPKKTACGRGCCGGRKKVKMQYKPKPICSTPDPILTQYLFTQCYIFPFFLHYVASIFKSIISQLSCLRSILTLR